MEKTITQRKDKQRKGQRKRDGERGRQENKLIQMKLKLKFQTIITK